jgi:hypothetical protein
MITVPQLGTAQCILYLIGSHADEVSLCILTDTTLLLYIAGDRLNVRRNTLRVHQDSR